MTDESIQLYQNLVLELKNGVFQSNERIAAILNRQAIVDTFNLNVRQSLGTATNGRCCFSEGVNLSAYSRVAFGAKHDNTVTVPTVSGNDAWVLCMQHYDGGDWVVHTASVTYLLNVPGGSGGPGGTTFVFRTQVAEGPFPGICRVAMFQANTAGTQPNMVSAFISAYGMAGGGVVKTI